MEPRDHAHEVFDIDYLIAIINPDNVPSQRVAEKLGLSLERLATFRTRSDQQRIYSMKL